MRRRSSSYGPGSFSTRRTMKCTRDVLRGAAVVIVCMPRVSPAQAATATRPAYAPERYDEDWSFLRDPSKRTDFFDPIKWIPFAKEGSWYLTFAGELRERFQDIRNSEFGFTTPPNDRHGYHRIFLIADTHLGPHFRTFVELVNGEIIGAITNPPPAEQDPLDLQQAFSDLILPVSKSEDFTLR